jgi:aldose 1-epimerase
MKIEKKVWANTESGEVCLYTLHNGEMEISLTNFGCSVTDIIVGDKNIIAGYSNFADLEKDKYYMGCLVGRYAGRIANASIDIDGVSYPLTANDGVTGHHLHGGFKGFNRIVFKEVYSHTAKTFAALTFRGISQHMEEGYPGTVDLTVTITLNVDNEIIFSYYAITDKPTHINLTHHLYYNLNGREQPSDQQLQIKAEHMLQTSGDYIPTGQIVEIPADLNFSAPRKIPANAAFNECYVVNDTRELQKVAELSNKDLSLTMQVASTCPGLIFYSGQFLAAPFSPGQAICLETQYYPDSPHHQGFPSTLYDQKKTYKEFTKLSFIKAI